MVNIDPHRKRTGHIVSPSSGRYSVDTSRIVCSARSMWALRSGVRLSVPSVDICRFSQPRRGQQISSAGSRAEERGSTQTVRVRGKVRYVQKSMGGQMFATVHRIS